MLYLVVGMVVMARMARAVVEPAVKVTRRFSSVVHRREYPEVAAVKAAVEALAVLAVEVAEAPLAFTCTIRQMSRLKIIPSLHIMAVCWAMAALVALVVEGGAPGTCWALPKGGNGGRGGTGGDGAPGLPGPSIGIAYGPGTPGMTINGNTFNRPADLSTDSFQADTYNY